MRKRWKRRMLIGTVGGGSGGVSSLLTGLGAYWNLDETSGNRAAASGGGTLTDNNSVGSAAGKVGNAALFVAASSRYLSAADAAWQALTTAASWSFWLKPTTISGSQTVASKWAYQTDGCWGIRQTGDSKIDAFIAVSDTDNTDNHGATPAVLNAGTWTHVAIVYDGGGANNAAKLKIWTDGVVQTLTFTGTIPTTIRSSAAPFYIGRWGGTVTQYLNSAIDEFKIWNRAITAGEIAEDYANGLAGRPLL